MPLTGSRRATGNVRGRSFVPLIARLTGDSKKTARNKKITGTGR